MGGAISICANNSTREKIVSLWREAGRFENNPSMLALNYPPHFTFAIYDEIVQEELHQAARMAVAGLEPVRVTFKRINYFDVSPLVLWASPEKTEQLEDIHHTIHTHLAASKCREHYLPDRWVPHCTLAVDIKDDKRRAALEFAWKDFDPFEVIFDSVECVSFPPVVVTERLTLD